MKFTWISQEIFLNFEGNFLLNFTFPTHFTSKISREFHMAINLPEKRSYYQNYKSNGPLIIKWVSVELFMVLFVIDLQLLCIGLCFKYHHCFYGYDWKATQINDWLNEYLIWILHSISSISTISWIHEFWDKEIHIFLFIS